MSRIISSDNWMKIACRPSLVSEKTYSEEKHSIFKYLQISIKYMALAYPACFIIFSFSNFKNKQNFSEPHFAID